MELDKRALFALASDTRLDILKSLQPMRRTVTQLAETLGIDKAAVHRHLKTLEEGGFVKRYEDHGFVYYGLSWKSRDLLSPNENTRVVILLSACVAFIGVAVLLAIAASIASGLISPWGDEARRLMPDSDGDQEYEAAASYAPVYLVLVVGVVMLSSAAALTARRAMRVLHRPRQPGMRNDRPG